MSGANKPAIESGPEAEKHNELLPSYGEHAKESFLLKASPGAHEEEPCR